MSHYNTLQHTAAHCNTLQHTATHCNTLKYTATHCNTSTHTRRPCNILQHTATHCNSLQSTGYVPEIVSCLSKKIWKFLDFAGTKSPLLSGTDFFIPLFAKYKLAQMNSFIYKRCCSVLQLNWHKLILLYLSSSGPQSVSDPQLIVCIYDIESSKDQIHIFGQYTYVQHIYRHIYLKIKST